MTQKALIVGISDYGGKAAPLASPMREIREWRDLLVEMYQFPHEGIRLLANDRATKDAIVERLHWLFDGGRPGDQLVFIYCGHAGRVPERNPSNGELLDHLDDALITYPSQPTDDLAKMAYYDDDLLALYDEARLPAGTDATFIFDCCNAAGINLHDLPRRPTAMSVMLPIDLQHRTLGRHQPNQPNRRRESNGTAVPVFVSAAGELNLAVEVDIDGGRRSLFSFNALAALRKNPKLTYMEFLSTIRGPMNEVFAQFPRVLGNAHRLNNPFFQ